MDDQEPLKEDSNELEKLVCLDNKGLQSRNENPSSGLTSNNGRGVVLLKTHLVSELVYPTDISLKESPAVFETNKQDTDSSSNQVKKDVFLSYNHSQQELCLQIQQALEKEGFNVWIDEKCVQGDLLQCIAECMENAPVFLMLISKQYYESFYCQAEAEYAFELRKKIIPIVMQKDYKAHGWLGLIKGTKFHIDFIKFSFDEAMQLLIRQIKAALKQHIVDENGQRNISSLTQSIKTMKRTLICPDNIKNWNGDDVIQWLIEKKLEIFQGGLSGFTGATLWELYKLKLDFPSQYAQNIELLLSKDTPHRLFYVLTFNGAIESLFSPSNNS